jgi:hypothetical protein
MTNRSLDTNWTIGNYYKNRYREVDDYIEVEIYGGGEYHIGQIDKVFLNRFTERTWGAKKQTDGKIFYMESRATKKFPSDQKFHRLVIPDVDQVDHKDGNTLDNRKKNLRDGSGVINNNNKALHNTNTSGTNGVSFDKTNKRWNATWYENGKQQKANFSITKYGSDEKAKQEAIKHRKAMNVITGSTNGDR